MAIDQKTFIETWNKSKNFRDLVVDSFANSIVDEESKRSIRDSLQEIIYNGKELYRSNRLNNQSLPRTLWNVTCEIGLETTIYFAIKSGLYKRIVFRNKKQ